MKSYRLTGPFGLVAKAHEAEVYDWEGLCDQLTDSEFIVDILIDGHPESIPRLEN